MSENDTLRSRRSHIRNMILKGLFLYILCPILLLTCLAQPIGAAVLVSDRDAYGILAASFVLVCLNWIVYAAVHRKRPPLTVFSYGVFCLFAVWAVEYEALPGYHPLSAVLAVIGGCLALALLFLLSFWFASRRSRPAHAAAASLWITIGLISVFMLYQIIRDIESRNMNRDTWVNIAILAAVLLAACERRIRFSLRRIASRHRATGLAAGRIIQMIGETHLDRNDDLVTNYHAKVQYTVDNTLYEIHAGIRRITMRKFGRKAFIGREIPVHYNPENPGDAYAKRIDRHFFDSADSETERLDVQG